MYKLFIAWRFLWSRLVSYIGAGLLALAVMLFIVVMAVMEGMGEVLRESIRKSNAHVEILAPAGPGIAEWRDLSERIASMEHVVGVTPFVTGVGQAESTLYRFQCLVRGVDLERERAVGGLGPYLKDGTFKEHTARTKTVTGVIVGHRIASRMEINPDKRELLRLSVQRPDGESTGVAVFYISGKFKTESLWFDNNLLISLDDAQKLFGTGDRVTGLGVWLGDDYKLAYRLKRRIQHMLIETSGYILSDEEKGFFESLSIEPQTPEEIARRAGLGEHEARRLLASLIEKGAAREVGHMEDHYVESTEPQVKTWAEQQPDIFRAVAQESLIMRVILVIVIGFVAVLVLCLLWVMVEQKIRDIGIMVAIGARTGGVVSIFVLDGLFIGLVGTALGLVLGVSIATHVDPIAKLLGLDIFPESQFYIGEVPSTIVFADLVVVSVVAITCSVLASILPALRAAAADPIESLRHE